MWEHFQNSNKPQLKHLANLVMLAIASWAPEDVQFKLNINWEKLGLDPKKAKIKAPYIKDFQEAKNFDSPSNLSVKKNQGWLLIIE